MRIRGSACYLDSSALVKLAADEAESSALRVALGTYPVRLTSRLATVEVPRALSRKGGKRVEAASELFTSVLEGVGIIEVDADIAARAVVLAPVTLRSLDAIHLASALSVGDELVAVITYDLRMADAARATGLIAISPA